MVKWLEEITVSAEPSNNFYHFHDNRVLPSHVTEKMAKEEGAAALLLALPLQLADAMYFSIPAKDTDACALPSMMEAEEGDKPWMFRGLRSGIEPAL